VEGSREHGNELQRYIKYYEILEYLSDWRLLKKDSVPWSSLLYLIALPCSCYFLSKTN
jgi:hypothetical protein